MSSPIRFKTGLAALAMALSACGAESSAAEPAKELPTLETLAGNEGSASDGGEDESPETDPQEVDPEKAMAEFEACMADFGIDVSIAGGPGGAAIESFESDGLTESDIGSPEDFSEDRLREAAAECDPILGNAFGDFEMSPEQEAEFADQMLEMGKCLSDLGFEIDLQGGSFTLSDDVDFEALDAAMTECQPDFAAFGSQGSE